MLQALRLDEYIEYFHGKGKPIKSMTLWRALVQSICRTFLASQLANAIFLAFDISKETASILWYSLFTLGCLMPFEAMLLIIATQPLQIPEAITDTQRLNALLNRSFCRDYLDALNCPEYRTMTTASYVHIVENTLVYLLVKFMLFYVVKSLHCGGADNTAPITTSEIGDLEKKVALNDDTSEQGNSIYADEEHVNHGSEGDGLK